MRCGRKREGERGYTQRLQLGGVRASEMNVGKQGMRKQDKKKKINCEGRRAE